MKQRPENCREKVRPLFCGRAVFADECAPYLVPEEPRAGERVTIRIRTLAENVDTVLLRMYEADGLCELPMKAESACNGFCFYRADFTVGTEPVPYEFELVRGQRRMRYSRVGLTGEMTPSMPFRILPGYHIPEWARGAIMYQIFPDRFANGDPENDVEDGEIRYLGHASEKVKDWNDPPKPFDVHRYYGGDLAGIIQKLDYLQELGVEVLYLNPIFVSPSNHKYDTQDYFHVDPHLGKILVDEDDSSDKEDDLGRYRVRTTREKNLLASDKVLAELITKAHERGMRVILDGVFNHCGSFSRWFDREQIYECSDGTKGAYFHADSPYRAFFHFSDPDGWPENDSCSYWWGNRTLPKLAYESSDELTEQILSVAEKWISAPYHADGWRLDVAADLGQNPEVNHAFWKRFRERVRRIEPDALILAEHYGDPAPYLSEGEWDTVMNYDAFMEPVSFFLTGMEKHSDAFFPHLLGDGEAFFTAMRFAMSRFGTRSAQCAMNELSNHDHSRFLTRTNHRCGRLAENGTAAAGENVCLPVMRLAILLQMTWPGAPTIYYGDEAGVVGFTDPDNRRTYPWGRENIQLLRFYRDMAHFHKENAVLRTGSFKALSAGKGVIAYARFTMEEAAVVVLNMLEETAEVTIPVWETGLGQSFEGTMEQRILTGAEHAWPTSQPVRAEEGMVSLKLAPFEGSVLLSHIRHN